jgi:hypothetical protein
VKSLDTSRFFTGFFAFFKRHKASRQ